MTTLQQEISQTIQAMIIAQVPQARVYNVQDIEIVTTYRVMPAVYQSLGTIRIEEDHVMFDLRRLYAGQSISGRFRFEYADPQFPQLMLTMMRDVATEYEQIMS